MDQRVGLPNFPFEPPLLLLDYLAGTPGLPMAGFSAHLGELGDFLC